MFGFNNKIFIGLFTDLGNTSKMYGLTYFTVSF